jgi:ATP-dependent Clp protease ATP-binding subunit ClpA
MAKHEHMFDGYQYIRDYTTPLKQAEREIIGREQEIRSIKAAFARPELCNVILLAEAGSGKTALVQGTMLEDIGRIYLEVNLSKMIANLRNENEMADKLKQLFDEVVAFGKTANNEIVLFIDEFHQIAQLSSAATEVLKPLLADSGTRGVRVIAATTYDEFREHISKNQPLVERLQRINLRQPNKEMTVKILKGMAVRYDVIDDFYDDTMFELIYEYTNRYIPASSQPRKSIKMLDSMVGWHRSENRKLDAHLLADVIYESEGVNIAFRVDATKIKDELDKYVFAQKAASTAIAKRLNICVADLNDSSKPMSTMLFTGSTGVGKTEMTKQLARVLFEDERNLIRFDMSEYANQDSLERFRSELTARVWERPYSIILLDEIEKSNAAVTRVLLQVLDDARLSDINNREVSFTNCYIILTTNAASEVYREIAQYAVDDEGSGEVMEDYERLIKRSLSETQGDGKFPPELIGRLDAIVPFQPLSENTLNRIVRSKLERLKHEVQMKHGMVMSVDKRVIDYLVKDNLTTDSDAGGARLTMAKLESEVTTAVSHVVNLYKDRGLADMTVTVEGTGAYENKQLRKGDMHIVITTGLSGTGKRLYPGAERG